MFHRQNSHSRFKSRANVLAILRCTARKPSRLLMIITSLCPGDAVACLLGLRQTRDGDLFDLCSEPADTLNRSMKTFLDFTGNHIEEKVSRYPEPKFRELSCGTLAATFDFPFAIPAGNSTKKNRRIRHGPCQRPHTV